MVERNERYPGPIETEATLAAPEEEASGTG